MDEFGVLTERYGLKPQGKAAPMNSSKRPAASNNFNSPDDNVSFDFPQSKTNQNFGAGDDYADIFGGSKGNTNTSNGVSFGFESVFDSGVETSKSNSCDYGDQDDIFGGLTGLNSSNSNKKSDDVFPSFASPPKQSSPIDDLLGGFNNSGQDDDVFGVFRNNHSETTSNGSVNGRKNQNVGGFDDLIPGFGSSGSPSDNSHASQPQQSAMRSTKSNSVLSEDPFVVLESTSGQIHTSSDPLEELSQFGNFRRANGDVHKEKSPDATSIDELEAFAMGGFKKNVNAKATNGKMAKAVSAGDVKIAAEKIHVNIKAVPKPSQKTTSGYSSNMKRASSATNIVDNLSSIFGDESFFGDFEEVEGESEERRRARLGRQGRTQQRVAKAVAEMNQREFQTQQEQEEKHRIAEALDAEIKRWAAGKESNMRALLSSLQQLLWPECGWEPVSITDLITSTSVKKVYRKATLCVHPDKVQQKGANLQQKYIAEKVFDILKEAYTKFSMEELR